MEFLHMCSSMLSIVLMVAVGMLLTKKKWITEEIRDFLIKVTVNLALPTLMFKNIYTNFTREEILKMGSSVILPLISITITMVIGIVAAYLLKIPAGKKGLFISMFFNSNTIFVGLPVNLALNGESCLPYVMLYYMASTILFWTLGVYFIAMDNEAGIKRKLFSMETLKSILSLPLVAFVAAVLWLIIGIPMPGWLLDTLGYFGNLTTPLSMIFIGTCICNASLKEFRFRKEIIGVLFGRFFIAPCVIMLLLHVSSMDSAMGRVFLIQAAMPVMTNTAILARAYNCDEDYAAIMTVLTTIACIIVVPIYCSIFDVLF